MTAPFPELGDRVLILDAPETAEAGYAGVEGLCHRFMTPSVTEVDVVGAHDDIAVAVWFEDDGTQLWFAPDLVEVLDHSPGLEAVVGDKKYVRTTDGSWRPVGWWPTLRWHLTRWRRPRR